MKDIILLGVHLEREENGSVIEEREVYLHLVNNKYYEVYDKWSGTSGGKYSTTWNTEENTHKYNSLEEVYQDYPHGYFDKESMNIYLKEHERISRR